MATNAEKRITTLPLQVNTTAAQETLRESDEAMERVNVLELLYYPYGIFVFDIHAEALLNSFQDEVVCGIDLVNGKELLIDETLDPDVKPVPDHNVLSAKKSLEDAKSAARTYLMEVAQQRLKVIRSPTITLQDHQRLYRPFHFLKCNTTDGRQYYYAVDGVTGDFHRVYM